MKEQTKEKLISYTGRTLLVIATLLVAAVILAYSIMFVLAKGPSPVASDLFVRSVMETSAAKFLARIYFSEAEIEAILQSDDDGDGEITDPSLIVIPQGKPPADTSDSNNSNNNDTADITDDDHSDTDKVTDSVGGDGTSTTPADDGDEKDEGIEIIKIQGDTYNGTLMIVTDPSRVSIGTLPVYGEGYSGKSLRKFIEDNDAIAGINAGGFWDEGGKGTGSVPDGIVIRDGEIIWGDADTSYKCVIGFDENHILRVGNMTGKEALDAGIVNGLNFGHGPMLVCNGVPQNSKRQLGGGLNPRTAIGQRSDGAILLLVINGRQADSLGATYNDLVNVMVKYGAVNAANLDGGSSTLMVYRGEALNQSAYFFGERKLPNVFLVGAGEE